MASWFKVAEDLLEVVDRRAKQVKSDLTDEQSNSQPVVSGQEQIKRLDPKEKGQSVPVAPELSTSLDNDKDESSSHPLASHENSKQILNPETETVLSRSDSDAALRNRSTTSTSTSNLEEFLRASALPFSETLPVTTSQSMTGPSKEVTEDQQSEVAISSVNHEDNMDPVTKQDGPETPPPLKAAETDFRNREVSADVKTEISEEVLPQNSEGKLEMTREEPTAYSVGENGAVSDQKAAPEKKEHVDSSSIGVQAQLDEAQGLLKIAKTSGQSKEARLAKVCAGLSSRLQEYKSENAQLEELLSVERNQRSKFEAEIKHLQQDLLRSRANAARVESDLEKALAAKNSEIEALVVSMDSLKKQTAASEGKLTSMQATMEELMRNRELTETRMIQALREEVASAERRAEEERAAHNASKMTFMEREVELEQRAVEASTALARVQRIADERTSTTSDLEHKISMLEVECASLNQELQDVEARAKRTQKKSPEESNQTLQAWQEEVEKARQGQREAENKLFTLEAELQKMRVDMAGMKRDAEHYSRQEHVELEKRYQELTDLLYFKQTQLETMTSEKAAAEFQLEKELKRLREAQVEVERTKAMRRSSAVWEEEADPRALETLPLHHRHMVGAQVQLQKAAKILDSGAVRVTKLLWRYPVARMITLFYLVFVHIFLLYLLHRLQDQADRMLSSKDVAAAMGMDLVNQQLP